MTAHVDALAGRVDSDVQSAPYVTALRASDLFADPAYQRDPDEKRIAAMAAAFNPRLLGVLEVSDRDNGTYAVLDGQHRWRTVLRAHPDQGDAFVVCQVYDGLDVEGEARMFHQINKARKALSWWDEWKARRTAGDDLVHTIDQVLAEHGLKIDPAPRDGNVRAVAAVQRIITDLGGPDTLRWVLTVLSSAWGKAFDAYSQPLLLGAAMVFTNYDVTDDGELDIDRLVRALSEMPPQQVRARAVILRESVRAELPRLAASVMINRYNEGRGRSIPAFLERAPKNSKVASKYRHVRPTPAAPTHNDVDDEPPAAELADEFKQLLDDARAFEPLGDVMEERTERIEVAGYRPDDPSPAPTNDVEMCACGHGRFRHDGTDDGAPCTREMDCGCAGFGAAS